MTDLLYKEEVYRIIGCAMEVHSHMGPGFHEAVYEEPFEFELQEAGVAFQSQVVLKIKYKAHILKKEYIADMICMETILVELKALDKLSGKEESQVLNYLKATGLHVGLLINFGSHGKLEWKRFVL